MAQAQMALQASTAPGDADAPAPVADEIYGSGGDLGKGEAKAPSAKAAPSRKPKAAKGKRTSKAKASKPVSDDDGPKDPPDGDPAPSSSAPVVSFDDFEEVKDDRTADERLWWRDYEEPDKPIGEFTAREVGIQGEALACRYLSKRGLQILDQNWRCRDGEVDIIAREEDGEVALIEVKTRLNLDGDPASMPELAVDGKKQRRYRRLAPVYLMLHSEVQRLRFDVIAINIQGDHAARLRHLVGTFTWDS